MVLVPPTGALGLLLFCLARTSKRPGRWFVHRKRRRAMRKLGVVLTLAALVGVAYVPPGAANAKAEDKDVSVVLVERIQDLNLTADQEAKIADIRKDYRSKVQDAAKGLAGIVKEEEDKIRAILTPEQQEKVRAMKEERAEHRGECLAHALTNLKELDLTDAEMAKLGEIRQEFRPKIAKAMESLRGILTDAQRKTREDTLAAGKGRKEVLEALNLTADQKNEGGSRRQGTGNARPRRDGADWRRPERGSERASPGLEGRAQGACP
jgi:hypothetical protein